jgi:hypothetical protein
VKKKEANKGRVVWCSIEEFFNMLIRRRELYVRNPEFFKNGDMNKLFVVIIIIVSGFSGLLNAANLEDDTKATVEKYKCISGDCVNGLGTKIWPNGSKYIGEFENGQINGKGTRYLPNGSIDKKGLWGKGEYISQ